MIKTACPLDCYDACSIVVDGEKLKGEKDHPVTQGYLCPLLNRYSQYERIESPMLNGDKISMNEALEKLTQELKFCEDAKTIFFKGSGNFGRMQDVANLFFSQYSSYFTKGSLCDSAGDSGIVSGRGVNLSMSPEQIGKSEVVVIWGRNITVTNSHLLPFLKNKIVIVIDPVKTEIAKRADLHLQINPRSDFYFTMLLSRIAYLEEMENEEFIEKYTEDYDYFIDFIRSFSINKLLSQVDIKINDIYTMLSFIKDKKVSFIVGAGVQKYTIGNSVLRAIDSFAAMLGLFGKEGCGVNYLSDSGLGFYNPFQAGKKRVSKPIVNFGEYDFVFIQGANPAVQNPNTQRVIDGLKKSKFVVYFGLHENETSKLADLVIPAKTFLEKEDVRFSYGHEYIHKMPKVYDSNTGISEYELTNFLCDTFGYDKLKSEEKYIDEIVKSNAIERGEKLISKSFEMIPYKNGFYTGNEKFLFIDEIDDDFETEEEGYFLVTVKNKNSLNSQFKTDPYLYIPESLDFQDEESVKITSIYGSYIFKVRKTNILRNDTFLLYSGNTGVNFLTPDIESNEGHCAVYQEVKLKIERIH